ncbi:hypothetical protein NLJ89_g9096 [Agrocybe chaxingu]|uniref:Uncharacterized protein n=1 Tax=Agrocybe chaxingu TaxID=84603 RepID=A0A9W8MTV5_9AGAR|nr:hypothetical protein NLJ89_g9096 [Agrocybe chaxingu]
MALYALKHPLTPEVRSFIAVPSCHSRFKIPIDFNLPPGLPPHVFDHHIYPFSNVGFQISGIAIAQTILYLRTIAIWERNPKVIGILGTMFIATVTVGIISTKRAMDMLSCTPPSSLIKRAKDEQLRSSVAPNIVAPLWFGCTVRTTTPIILVLGIMILISETTIVILTLIRAYQRLRYSSSSWVHQLYTRGYIYYFYMLGLTILNIVIPFLVVPPLRTLFADPQRCLHSIICNRIIFLIHSRQKVDRRTATDNEGASSRRASRMPWSQTQTGDVVILSTVLNTFHTDPEHYDVPGTSTIVVSSRVPARYGDSSSTAHSAVQPLNRKCDGISTCGMPGIFRQQQEGDDRPFRDPKEDNCSAPTLTLFHAPSQTTAPPPSESVPSFS